MDHLPAASRRTLLTGAGAALLPLARPARAQAPRPGTLRYLPSANLSFIDPSISTAGVTLIHGFAVFDQLYGVDSQNRPRPQMVEGHTVSADNRVWTFRLRDGLKFHDGEPVRGRDCIASIKRWSARDSFGGALAGLTERMDAPDDRSFRIHLKRPMGVVIDALAHPAPIPLFILPERFADTDPYKQVTEMIGSGPLKFIASEYVPGSHVAYSRNDAYVPRDEPADWTAGGKRMSFDRVEWSFIPDQATAAAALQNNEIDWFSGPVLDVIPSLRKHPGITVMPGNPFGLGSVARFNCANPPFDNIALRRIFRDAVDQTDYIRAIQGDEPGGHECFSEFLCGIPGVTEYRRTTKAPRNLAEARDQVKAAGYNGEKIVIINPMDYAVLSSQGEVSADLLKKLGFNVELAAMDFGTMLQRRNSKAPVDKGGWSMFHTTSVASSLTNPAVNYFTRGPETGGWAGWYISAEAERLTDAWMTAPTEAERNQAFAAAQRLAWDDAATIPLGFWQPMTAFRKDITNVLQCDYSLFWNMRRA